MSPSPDSEPLGAILAGGASSRFGAPKALAKVGGRRIIDRVRMAVADAVRDAVLIANEPAVFGDVDLPTRPDR
ncbi:MAG: NTP transferase domain-containing protein, partial [Gemmatimonadetes bacterium]|nr:NTP transferase domain-containing protein [Gemmatimonadota bacterium]